MVICVWPPRCMLRRRPAELETAHRVLQWSHVANRAGARRIYWHFPNRLLREELPCGARLLLFSAKRLPDFYAGMTDNRCRILVVDDNELAGEFLGELLVMSGHAVCTAIDAASALDRARDFLPTIAFVDLWLAGVDGCEVARGLREIAGLETLTLVALTGDSSAATRQRALEAGFDEYMIKPLWSHELEDFLGRVGRRGNEQ